MTDQLLFVGALILFTLDACGVVSRVKLTPAGLALCVLTVLL